MMQKLSPRHFVVWVCCISISKANWHLSIQMCSPCFSEYMKSLFSLGMLEQGSKKLDNWRRLIIINEFMQKFQQNTPLLRLSWWDLVKVWTGPSLLLEIMTPCLDTFYCSGTQLKESTYCVPCTRICSHEVMVQIIFFRKCILFIRK
jgi:hypothetical protein